MPNKKMRGSGIIQSHIERLEAEHRERLYERRMRFAGSLEPLPHALQKRVEQILKFGELQRITDGQQQQSEETAPTAEEPEECPVKAVEVQDKAGDHDHDKTREPSVEQALNESTISFVLDKDLKHDQLHLNIEPPPEKRRAQTKTVNWMANMLRQKRSDRVCWPSKLYHFDRKFSQKTLFEQAEQMMDMAAEDFADWLANLGNDREMTLTKEILMQLFSITIEGDSAKALFVEPRPRKAVPSEVAAILDMPSLAIEHNVRRLLDSDAAQAVTVARKVGFGRTLPHGLYVEKSDAANIPPVQPKFPPELRSKRTIFHGITHLRSTKAIVAHLEQHPDVRRPQYLVQNGLFAVKASDSKALSQERQPYRPLYADFLNKALQ